MVLTPSQAATLKADIAANTNQIPSGKPWSGAFSGIAVKDVPNTGDGNAAVAGFYNDFPTPDYWVWGTGVSRVSIYNSTSPDGTLWDWTIFKNQSVTEQGAWREMFMGDSANFAMLNLRQGVGKIFSGAGSAVNRIHALAMGRRKCLRSGKLFAVAVVGGSANDGNDMIVGNRGKASNPDVMTFEGTINGDDVQEARNLA